MESFEMKQTLILLKFRQVLDNDWTRVSLHVPFYCCYYYYCSCRARASTVPSECDRLTDTRFEPNTNIHNTILQATGGGGGLNGIPAEYLCIRMGMVGKGRCEVFEALANAYRFKGLREGNFPVDLGLMCKRYKNDFFLSFCHPRYDRQIDRYIGTKIGGFFYHKSVSDIL